MKTAHIIVYLFAELFLAEFVERVELLGQDEVLLEAAAGQLDADDDGAVWNHHRYCPEVDLEVLRQLLTARVAGILQITAQLCIAGFAPGGWHPFHDGLV